MSHSSNANHYGSAIGVLGILGLAAPMVVAFIMILKNPKIKNDLWGRILSIKGIKPIYIYFTLLIMPLSILLAQSLSLLLGHSIDQFHFASHGSFAAGMFPAWFFLILAPILEELAWHSYGTDCLRSRFNLFYTSLIFAVLWVMWHIPLGLIQGYYHSNVAESGLLYSLNFIVSLFPFVILMNWLYYKSNRNILVAILLHIGANVSNEIFMTHPDSKVIQTGLLLIVTFYILFKDKKLFFEK